MRALLLCAFALSACSVELQHDLTEEDANEVYVVLHEKGFRPQKVRDETNPALYAITVSKADVSRATQLLTNRGLPRSREPGFSLITKSQSVIPTQIEERTLFIQALSGEVANTLKRIPKVVDARVIVNVPQSNDLQLDAKPAPSASVYLKYQSADETGIGLTEEQLKAFVSTAVPDLKPESISVVMMRAATRPDPEPTTDLLSPELLKALVATLATLLVVVSGAAISLLFRVRKLSRAPAG